MDRESSDLSLSGRKSKAGRMHGLLGREDFYQLCSLPAHAHTLFDISVFYLKQFGLLDWGPFDVEGMRCNCWTR